jgi:hypothetical protein
MKMVERVEETFGRSCGCTRAGALVWQDNTLLALLPSTHTAVPAATFTTTGSYRRARSAMTPPRMLSQWLIPTR